MRLIQFIDFIKSIFFFFANILDDLEDWGYSTKQTAAIAQY